MKTVIIPGQAYRSIKSELVVRATSKELEESMISNNLMLPRGSFAGEVVLTDEHFKDAGRQFNSFSAEMFKPLDQDVYQIALAKHNADKSLGEEKSIAKIHLTNLMEAAFANNELTSDCLTQFIAMAQAFKNSDF